MLPTISLNNSFNYFVCLLGTEHRWREDSIGSALFIIIYWFFNEGWLSLIFQTAHNLLARHVWFPPDFVFLLQ